MLFEIRAVLCKKWQNYYLLLQQLLMQDAHAELLPEDKESVVRQYQQDGSVVMMVGDGVNDAPSLVQSDIGIAIGVGTDVAVESADVILVKSDPADILHFLSLAQNTAKNSTKFVMGFRI